MATVTLNESIINNALDAALNVVAEQYADAHQKAIQAKVWDWPRRTKRRNGKTAELVRDIVDTRRLLNSLQPVRVVGDGFSMIWSAPHARIVFKGWDDQKAYPGRNWHEYANRQYDIRAELQKQVSQSLGG